MPTDAQSLLRSASSYAAYSAGEWRLMIIALLRQIALSQNPVAAVDPKSLLAQAACYQCFGDPGSWMLMELALLAQIASGGGVGFVCIVGGIGPPNIPVPCEFSAWIEQPGPNFGLWLGDMVTGWAKVLTQGP